MGSDLGCCANFFRILLIVLNIIFGALGVVVFAVGIWAVVQDQNYSFVTGSTIVSGAGILIFAGIVTMIICVVGILGAVFKLRPLLVTYAVAVFVVVVLEIIAGIVAFAFRDAFLEEFEERSIKAIDLYRVDPDSTEYMEDVNDFVAFIQDAFNCCGFNNASDWILNNSLAIADNGGSPPKCDACMVGVDDDCIVFSDGVVDGIRFNATTRGCGDFASDRLTVFAYAVGGIGIAFGIMEIFGIVFALFLCCCITSARKQEVV